VEERPFSGGRHTPSLRRSSGLGRQTKNYADSIYERISWNSVHTVKADTPLVRRYINARPFGGGKQLSGLPLFHSLNIRSVTNNLYRGFRTPHTCFVRAKSPQNKASCRPTTIRRSTGGSNSLFRNILPATHSFSIFHRQTSLSHIAKPKKPRTLRNSAKKVALDISPHGSLVEPFPHSWRRARSGRVIHPIVTIASR